MLVRLFSGRTLRLKTEAEACAAARSALVLREGEYLGWVESRLVVFYNGAATARWAEVSVG